MTTRDTMCSKVLCRDLILPNCEMTWVSVESGNLFSYLESP